MSPFSDNGFIKMEFSMEVGKYLKTGLPTAPIMLSANSEYRFPY